MPPTRYKNRQKLMHNTRKIKKKNTETLEENLSDTIRTFSLTNSPVFRRDMTYQEMLKIDPFFRKNQIHYVSYDSVLGFTLISIAVDKFNIIHSHVFTCCGPLSLPLITPEDQDSLHVVVSHLPYNCRSKSFQVIAMVILQYFIFIPSHVKKEVLRQYNMSVGNSEQHRRIAFDEMHAGDIAGHCQLLKLLDLSSILCSMLKRRKCVSFNVDVILPDDLGSTPLFSKLRETSEQKPKDFSFEKTIVHNPEHDKKRISILNEILQTEQNYINRLRHLILDYVLPLRTQAKTSKNPPLGLYDVNRMFPLSLNDIISVNSAFLQDFMKAKTDLEKADSCVTHFSQFKKVYAKYLELSVDFESILRHNLRNPKFRDFVDTQKYKAERNISVRELIMEPVQRIPRYSLFLENIISNTHPESPALAPFQKALSIVKDIAQMKIMEAEEKSKLFRKLMGYVSGFPPELISNSRYFVTAIDAIEILPPYVNSSSKIYCTLLLFSDCLVILKKSSHVSVAELISNDNETSPSKFQSKQNSFKFVNSTSRKDILFQGWANVDDIEIEIDEGSDTDVWIITCIPIKSYIGNEAWGSFSQHKISIASESKHCIIDFIEKFYKTKAKNKISESFISEIEKNNINIICNVFKISEYKREPKKSEIAIQYSHQNFVNNINKRNSKIDISGLFLIEASSEILDFYTPLSWKISPQKFQYLDTLLEDLFQKAILFQNFLKFSESPKNVSLFISKYKFFLSCLLSLSLASNSLRINFPAISYSNFSNKRLNSILGNKHLPPRDFTASFLFNSPVSKVLMKKDSFLQSSSLIKSDNENNLSKTRNNSISHIETIKDRNIFHGVETFVYTLCFIEDFDSISTLIYSESELKDSIELSNEIAKNPQKDYAVLDKFDSINEKVSKIRDISLDLPYESHAILCLVIYLALHVLSKAYKEKCVKVLLLMISECLVSTYDVPTFVPVLKFMARNFSQIFYEFAKANFSILTNKATPIFINDSSQSGIIPSFTNSFYDEPFILPDTYISESDIINYEKSTSSPLKNSLFLNSVQKDISKETFCRNTSSNFSISTVIPKSKYSEMIRSLSHLETKKDLNKLNDMNIISQPHEHSTTKYFSENIKSNNISEIMLSDDFFNDKSNHLKKLSLETLLSLESKTSVFPLDNCKIFKDSELTYEQFDPEKNYISYNNFFKNRNFHKNSDKKNNNTINENTWIPQFK
ncbi:hypothetical protein PMAC_001929 [Pneumocystis sp. 'macacae']|nr:hypothetical protein PMAC_001929 [Pneumocystis sp. 'macacae']